MLTVKRHEPTTDAFGIVDGADHSPVIPFDKML